MKVLVACEFSGIVRDAFISKGHDAISCDILPTEKPGPHFLGPVGAMDLSKFDLLIAHPPCTNLAVNGARWWKDKKKDQEESINFFMGFVNCSVPKVAIENPIGLMSTKYRKPDQIIQPWQFGHGETKATCLWLKGLPLLKPSKVVDGREARIHKMPPSEHRWKDRSRTYQGIAEAMADQWG